MKIKILRLFSGGLRSNRFPVMFRTVVREERLFYASKSAHLLPAVEAHVLPHLSREEVSAASCTVNSLVNHVFEIEEVRVCGCRVGSSSGEQFLSKFGPSWFWLHVDGPRQSTARERDVSTRFEQCLQLLGEESCSTVDRRDRGLSVRSRHDIVSVAWRCSRQ